MIQLAICGIVWSLASSTIFNSMGVEAEGERVVLRDTWLKFFFNH